MYVTRLRVAGFRGFKDAVLHLPQHCVVIGPTSVGKSTVIDALSLVLGREQMVRDLTEHDFYGGDPDASARIRIIATLIGFRGNDPEDNGTWFRERRAVEKWWSKSERALSPERTTSYAELAVEIGFMARFNRDTLEIEKLRYFHHDDSMIDAFMEDGVDSVPASLLAGIGYFVVPAVRNRDRLLSFSSEIFRRLVTSHGALPASELLEERDRLRNPASKLEDSARLKDVVGAINEEFGRLLPQQPKFEMRVTATDSESLLTAIHPHFRYETNFSLPAHRHGSGLVSLQILIVLLEFGKARRNRGESFVLGLEEPELHLAPGLQRRVVHRARVTTDQSITTTHSPTVAAFYDPSEVVILERDEGIGAAETLASSTLAHDATNAKRKLFIDSRQQLIEALLHDVVLVPEGRSDYELLRLLIDALETSELGICETGVVRFGAIIGVAPTPDAQIDMTVEAIRRVRTQVVALLDGDDAGDRYAKDLAKLQHRPSVVLQWKSDETIEDVFGAMLAALKSEEFKALVESLPDDVRDDCGDVKALLELLKTKSDRKAGVVGLKMNLLVYEAITRAISGSKSAVAVATSILTEVVDAAAGKETDHFKEDARSTNETVVLQWHT